MNNIIKYISIIALTLFSYACSKEGALDRENSQVDKNSQVDNYYIHYIITSDRSNPVTITVNTEDGIKTFSSFPLDEIFGPVKKGFKAGASVSTEDHALKSMRA